MLTFLHAADIHLDSPLRGLSRYDSAPVEAIRDACRRAFINLVDLALERNVAFVLLAGDLYDGDWKDYSTGIFLHQQIGRLARQDIPVFAVAGNHDATNHMTKALEVPANMHLFSSRKTESKCLSLPGLDVAIHGRSFAKRHVDTNLVLDFPLAKQNHFNIGLLHTSLDGRPGHDNYAPCSMADLESRGYQYWALGHVHQQEIQGDETPVVFPGCIQGRHIRETGAKGCVLVTVKEQKRPRVQPFSLDVFRWASCAVDCNDAVDMRDILARVRRLMEDEFAAAEGRPLALRLNLCGHTACAMDLAAAPDRLTAQIRLLGAEIYGEDLWVEQVKNTTKTKLDLAVALADDSAFGRLLDDIVHTPTSPDDIQGLDKVLAAVSQKMPTEALASDLTLGLNHPETLKRLITEARQMLVGRLLQAVDEHGKK